MDITAGFVPSIYEGQSLSGLSGEWNVKVNDKISKSYLRLFTGYIKQRLTIEYGLYFVGIVGIRCIAA